MAGARVTAVVLKEGGPAEESVSRLEGTKGRRFAVAVVIVLPLESYHC